MHLESIGNTGTFIQWKSHNVNDSFYNMWKNYVYGLYFLRLGKTYNGSLSPIIFYILKTFWCGSHFGFSFGEKWKVGRMLWKAETELNWRKSIPSLTPPPHLSSLTAPACHHQRTGFGWPKPKEIKELHVLALSNTMRTESESEF